jgi:hypothetical protein
MYSASSNYRAMGDDDDDDNDDDQYASGSILPTPSAMRHGGGADTSGDEALAMKLAQEAERLSAVEGTERDEELALALAMAMEEEENYQEESGERPRRSSTHPPLPPPASVRNLVAPPQKANVDTASVAHSMFERIMSTFRGKSTTPAEKVEAKRARDAKLKERLTRQATVVLNIMEVVVPDFMTTENFLIMKPDGTVSRIHVPIPFQHPPFQVTFEGEPLIKSPPRILEESEQNSAFVDYYRFSPIEIEAEVDIIPGPRPLGGLELISQAEGVFVKWGVFPLPPSPQTRDADEDDYDNEDGLSADDHFQEMDIFETQNLICAGDLIVQVGDTATTSLEQLRLQIATLHLGSKVLVRVLRKPPPTVRCPMGHPLHLDDSRAALAKECDSCLTNFGRHHCVECGFSLCWPCYQIIYNHSKARFPRPVNNDHEYTEAPRTTRLTFSDADIGTKVLIFWYTTAEWWIGQIESFDEFKGHTVVYEERNGEKCREIIPNFEVREYRILTHCVLNESPVQPFHSSTLGHHSHRTSFHSAQVTPALSAVDMLSSSNPTVGADEPNIFMAEEEKGEEAPPQRNFLDASLNEAFTPSPAIDSSSSTSASLQHKVQSAPSVAPEEVENETVVLNEDESALLKDILGEDNAVMDDNGEGPP